MGTSFFKKYPLLAIIHHLPPIYHHLISPHKFRCFGRLVVDWWIIIKNPLNILHLRGVAGLCVGLFVGVAYREDVVQLVVRGDVETFEDFVSLILLKS